jgi:NADH-quinone oxidoreductase subunit M
MSDQLILPWISLSLMVLIGTAIWSWRQVLAERARNGAIVGMAISFLGLVAAGIEIERGDGRRLYEPLPFLVRWCSGDPLNGLLLPLFGGLTLGMVLIAPRRKITPQWISGLLILTASTLAAYAADNLAIFALAWSTTLIPFLDRRFFSQTEENSVPPAARIILVVSAVMLIAGVALIAIATPGTSPGASLSMSLPRAGGEPILYAAFAFVLIAIILRKGLFPAHSWVAPSFEQGPLIPLTLLFNGHLGAFAIARLTLPLLPDVSAVTLPLLGDLGLLTAAYTALLAISERKPRRLLALLAISQSSFLVAGLESSNLDAITGALVHWQVVVVATSALTAVYAAIEARLGAPLDGKGFLGLAKGAPRLAVFFAIAGLSLVGLPLTLGFSAEDLLLHGTLETHPLLGFILPIVTALNAFNIIRLFASLFLGKPGSIATHLSDALPRERWVLTAALLFLIIGGLFPAFFIHLPAKAAHRLTTTPKSALESAVKMVTQP